MPIKMQTAMIAALFSLMSFGLGTIVGSNTSAAQTVAQSTTAAAEVDSPQTAAPQIASLPENRDESDCLYLPPDHPLRVKLNGKRLPLNYAGLRKGEEKRLLDGAKVKPLSDGRLLVGLGDTLYMLDTGLHIQWQYKPSWMIGDFAAFEVTGLVYGTAGDNIFFILDGKTGEEKWAESHNGGHGFGETIPFGGDICLVTTDDSHYRIDSWQDSQANLEKYGLDKLMSDTLVAWRGTEKLWTVDFPPDAKLVVNGDNIYAVTQTDESIYVRKMHIPELKQP